MSMDLKDIARRPIFFERNRVARVYTGGKLFHDFFEDQDEDGFQPEEWVASSVRALNRDSRDPDEGVSRVKGTAITLSELIASQRELVLGPRGDLGILVKVLDSAVRLPVQAHPDKPFSRKHFASDYGKAEAWVVLATRENAKLYIGFKDRMTKERFSEAVAESERDKGAMERILNEIPVRKGEVYFITAKLVHAIGYGCLILEVQEPTDFTIQPEAWCGAYHLDDHERYLGLSPDTALDCFDYSSCGEAVVERQRMKPAVLADKDGLRSERLIGPGDTDCFAINRHVLTGGTLPGLNAPAVYIVSEGEGALFGPDGYRQPLTKGDYFLLPACASGLYAAESGARMELVECLPPAL
jgi:mannose-6-phosphate isomerase